MEDFTRELNQGSALFLLYGESGVGKTRLLRELSESRLSDRAIYWLDLDSDAGNDETRMDRSAEIEALFAAAGKGDIIIADHFEISLKKSRHQLFLSWSTDGIDKQLNLIIASSTDGLEELRQLSQQYQVQVQSFEQVPFNSDEVQAFLGFTLFPDQPTGKLTIPSPIRKQIASAQGVVARLIDIAEREGGQISSAAPAQAEPERPSGGRSIYALILLAVLAVGAGWYLLGQPGLDEIPALVKSESSSVTIAEAVPDAVVEAAPEAAPEATPEATPEAAAETAAESVTDAESPVAMESTAPTGLEDESTTATEAAEDSESMPDPELEIGQQPAPETTTAAEPEASTAGAEQSLAEPVTESSAKTESDTVEMTRAQLQPQAEPGTVLDSEAVIDESIIDNQQSLEATTVANDAEAVHLPETSQARFELDLRQSMDWIKQHDDRVGTVQILLLSYENFNPDNYYEYVANLVRRGADADKLHVFKTYTGNREVYSVVYDEFASRKAAIGAIDGLPGVLRDASPLGRSVGGLWQEIRRLEARN